MTEIIFTQSKKYNPADNSRKCWELAIAYMRWRTRIVAALKWRAA